MVAPVLYTSNTPSWQQLMSGAAPFGNALTNVVGLKPSGLSVSNNSSAGRSWTLKMAAPGDFDAVRLVIYHGSTDATTVYQAIVAATDEERNSVVAQVCRPIVAGVEYNTLDSTSEQYGWRGIKWAGADTITSAAGTSTVPIQNFSDWIPLSSVPRRDGTKFPLLLARISVTGGMSSFTASTAAGTGMETTTAANGGFILQGRFETDAAGAMVTDPASNNFTQGGANFGTITVGVQLRTRQKGITLIGIGDSLTQNGSTALLGDGFSSIGWRAAAAISELGVPCGYVNHGAASQTMQTFQPPGISAITNWRPNAVFMQSFSPNNSYSSAGVARYQLQQQGGLTEEVISSCVAINAAPFVTTGIPSSTSVIATAEIDNLRKSYNEKIRAKVFNTFILDWDQLLSNNQTPARLLSAYDNGDKVHPNATAIGLQASQLTAKLRVAFGI